MIETCSYTGIDFSFAICPKRRIQNNNNNNRLVCPLLKRQCSEGSYYIEDEEVDTAITKENTTTTTTEPKRSVRFVTDIVSQVFEVPRYERENLGELFYNHLDVTRFKSEARLERMQIKMLW